MNNLYKKGTRVRYISNDADGKYYPPYGTLGTCTGQCGLTLNNEYFICVKWDEGTKGDGKWYCYDTDLEFIEER